MTSPLAWAALLLGCQKAEQPDILFITVDTLRADALGVYGAARDSTPVLDALAASGWRAEEAMTVAPYTLPAHASMLTGLSPAEHGVHRNSVERLPESARTLAEVLDGHGWNTAAFVSAAVLNRSFGLDRGFQHFDDGPFRASTDAAVPERRGNDTVNAAIAWILAANSAQPMFVWVHLYDPHLPHITTEIAGKTGYEAEVTWSDRQVGALLEMRRSSRTRPAIIVVLSDHGEGLGDHGELTHGWFVYRSTMHVPWIMAGSGVPQRVESRPVSTKNVGATILDLLDLEPAGLGGTSVFASHWPDETVVGETFGPWFTSGASPLFVGRRGSTAYILAPRPEMYDVGVDPGEMNPLPDLASGHALHNELLEHFSATQQSSATASPAAVDSELSEQLIALGYTAGGEGGESDAARLRLPAGLAGLADPKDTPNTFEAISRLVIDARRVAPAQGVEMLQTAVLQFPKSQVLQSVLARGLVAAGDIQQAREVIRRLNVPEGDVEASIASLMLDLGQPELAVAHMTNARTTIGTSMGSPTAVAVEAEALRTLGRCTEALNVLSRHPGATSSMTHAIQGTCLLQLGRTSESIESLRTAAMADPPVDGIHLVLGTALLHAGQANDAVPELRAEHSLAPSLETAELLGLALAGASRHTEAIQLFREAEVRFGNLTWRSYAVLAECLRMTGAHRGERERAIARAAERGAAPEVLEILRRD